MNDKQRAQAIISDLLQRAGCTTPEKVRSALSALPAIIEINDRIQSGNYEEVSQAFELAAQTREVEGRPDRAARIRRMAEIFGLGEGGKTP